MNIDPDRDGDDDERLRHASESRLEHLLDLGAPAVERLTWRVREAAVALGCSKSIMYDLIARGEIPSIRLGRGSLRVPVEQLRKWIERQVDRQDTGGGWVDVQHRHVARRLERKQKKAVTVVEVSNADVR
jgi:excisionase family DNA binding protein